MKMTIRTLLYISITISMIFSNLSCSDATNHAEVGRQFQENMDLLTQEWYSTNNPSHDPKGSQPTEEDLRKMRIAARKKLDEIYKPESLNKVQNKKP